MGDTTTHIGLKMPGGGSQGAHGADETADVDVFNDNMKIIDGLPSSFLAANKGSLPNGWFIGQLGYSVADGVTYRWSNYAGTSQWRPWESDWANYNVGYQNVNFTFSGLNRWRYRAGRVLVELEGVVSANALNNGIVILSTPVDQFGSIAISRGAMVRGAARYPMQVEFYSLSLIQLYSGFPETPVTTASPATWQAGDPIKLHFEYDPA